MLTVEGLVTELGLELISGRESAKGHVRWVHSTELTDPTPWLRGGELLLTTGLQLQSAKAQRELIAHLAEHEIAGLGFGTGFAHKRLPVALADEARKRSFPLFEVPYELPFIAITERVFAQLLDERYEMLQRSMAGDVLAEALTGRLYPEELQARLRPFGIGERAAVLAFALADPGRSVDPAVAAPLVERILAREDLLSRDAASAGAASGRPPVNGSLGSLVAIRAGLLCAVVDGGPPAPGADGRGALEPIALARRIRAELVSRVGREVRASASRVAPTQSLRLSFHEARCALEAVRLQNNGNGTEMVASYADLGAFQLLLSLQDDDALLTYCRGVLGPVEAGEGEYGDELLRSLDVFIEHNGHWEKAASALYCHRHTLRYRIRRVEQLTGRDFTTARDRIEFWLALRGRELAR
jgi:Purine catabolism regulatory protein-like family/PucR C-terminal helix-turn-helix domain